MSEPMKPTEFWPRPTTRIPMADIEHGRKVFVQFRKYGLPEWLLPSKAKQERGEG